MNGAAAHRAQPGDRVIIAAYCGIEEGVASQHKPKLVYCDEANNITHTRNTIPVQAA